MRTLLQFVAAALLTFAIGACASGTGGVEPFTYDGTWTGTMQHSSAGTGTFSATMTEEDDALVGAWQATFLEVDAGGTLMGAVNDDSVVLELYPSNPDLCPYGAVLTREGNNLQGNFSAFDCQVVVTGTLNISK